MSTDVRFNNMLKDYMPYELLFEEVMKRDYFLSKVEKDHSWCEGPLQVPFMGGDASSFAYGSLTPEAEVTEDSPVRTEISSYKEIWGTMVFNQRDLDQHGSLEKSFLKILPDRLESFVGRMKEVVSVNLLNGTHFASYNSAAAANDLANGIIVTDRPARFTVGQYIEIATTAGALVAGGYVKDIDIDAKAIHIVDNIDIGIGADVNLAAAVATDKFFVRGARTAGNAFTSLKDQLLSPNNAAPYTGPATLHGVSKLLYPYLQAPNFDGSGLATATFLDGLFDFLTDFAVLGKGQPTDMVMSYKNLGAAMKQLQGGLVGSGAGGAQPAQTSYTITDHKANAFGWTEITLTGVKGKLTLVGVQEMDDDIIYMIDWRGIKLHSNEFFERRTAPDGKQFYETRQPSGYKYFVDTRFYGDLVVSRPSYCGIIYGVNL